MSTQRLNKYIAHHSGISRREADNLISSGRVTLNNQIADLGVQVREADVVAIDNKPLQSTHTYTYLAFHKPVGYICSRKRQGDTPTIFELLPHQHKALKPVGRLDKDSSGILLLTDDGDFAHQMTHPSFHKSKTYIVTLNRHLEPLHQQMISDRGISLEDGVSRFTVTTIEAPTYEISMHEGRNRQIRRTFSALGYEVVKLHRTQFGAYTVNDLASGSHRTIND